SSTQAAVTSGAGQTRDEQAGDEEHSEGAVVGAANTTDTDGAIDGGDSEVEKATADDAMVADAVDGAPEEDAEPVGPASFGQRLAAFEASGRTDENLEWAGAKIDAAAAAVGSGTVQAGRSSRRARAQPTCAGRRPGAPEPSSRNGGTARPPARRCGTTPAWSPTTWPPEAPGPLPRSSAPPAPSWQGPPRTPRPTKRR